MDLPVYPDLIDGAYAIVDPQLTGYAQTDVNLLRQIKVASARIQAYLGRVFSAVEVQTLPADIKEATVQLVVRALVTHTAGEEFRRKREQLGDYAYENEYIEPRGGLELPDAIRAMIDRYRATMAPAVVASAGWSVPPAEA